MSEPKLISPMLDNFAMGDPISDRNGIRCCPAMEKDTDKKYIVKIISTPASQTQLDALLLSGAYSDKEAALSYFKTLSDEIAEEAQILQKLSQLEGFVPFESCQIVPMEDETGFDVYLLSLYKNTLHHHFRRSAMTHLGALNLGLDLCAALAVCRRSGYLYVDLKPDNIYMTGEQEYRIGDIGFLRLDSLKYASLPDRYRSQYTAPEIADAFSALNMTIDVYAVGLILYQAFNDGTLPFRTDTAPAEEFPAPAYADYEMAEIILKACAPDPADRWQDPIEMGQALVSYMQRNGAHDTPIVPVPVQEPSADDEECVEDEAGSIADSEDTALVTEQLENAAADEVFEAEETDQVISNQDVTEESIYSEDEEGNLTFLVDLSDDETMQDQDPSEIDYEEVSEEVSDILLQADELISHPAPDPVVQPEPIDVPIPPPLPIDNEDSDEADDDEEQSQTEVEQVVDADDEDEELAEEADEEAEENPRKRSGHWLRNILIAVIAIALLAAGIFFYKNYYLQPIDSILLEESDNGNLTVHVMSQINEDKLTVICSDTYGNQLTQPVVNGQAKFTGLAPDSAYKVEVVISGFHRLTGDTSAAFTTPVQTNIIQFNAVTGSEDGSVILGFTIDGPDTSQWKVKYSSVEEPEKEISFSGHMLTLTGLTVGTEYTFTLEPENDLLVTGTNVVKHTASTIVKAVDLAITGCIDNTLTASWSAPEGATVSSWTVRCYNDSGFDETKVVTEPTVAFEGADPSASYTVEVTAVGMSVSERAYAAANSITVTNFAVDDNDPNKIDLTWEVNGTPPENEWLLLYTMDSSAIHEITCENGNTAQVPTQIPGVSYSFQLQAADGVSVLGGTLKYNVPAAQAFSGYGVSAEHMEFKMCKTPSFKNWDRYDLSSSDYTNTFSVGEDASFLVRMRHEYDTSSDNVTTLFVIRDQNGMIVSSATTSSTWTGMWYRNYCELDIPSIPQTPGKYTVSVYFNGSLANETDFTVTA